MVCCVFLSKSNVKSTKKSITFLSFLLCILFLSPLALAKTIEISSLNAMEKGCRGDDQAFCLKALREELAAQRSKSYNVVIIPMVSEYSEDSAKTATNFLKSVLVHKNMNIVDREVTDQLRDELITLEAGGKSSGITFNYADYAIKGEVLGLSTDRIHKIEEENCDPFGKDCPQRCTINVSTTVRATLYKMNPLEKVKDINFSKTIKQQYNGATEESCMKKDVAQDERKAIKEALEHGSNDVDSMFIQDGLVIGQRTDGKKHYFRTHLKKSPKYKEGASVEIVYWKTTTDLVLGDTHERKTVGKGKVVKSKGDEFVWIVLHKKSNPDDVFLGDVVKISSKCGKFSMDCIKGKAGRMSSDFLKSSQ